MQIRMGMRRFTKLKNAHSKRIEKPTQATFSISLILNDGASANDDCKAATSGTVFCNYLFCNVSECHVLHPRFLVTF